MGGHGVYGDWIKINEKGDMTTQRPAVLAIGPLQVRKTQDRSKAPGMCGMHCRVPRPSEDLVQTITDKMEPFQGDMRMLDFSTENMYSEHIIKLVSWHRHYTRFWKQSAQLCDFRWPDFLNLYGPKQAGATGIAEQRFFNDVTGKNFSFLDGINR